MHRLALAPAPVENQARSVEELTVGELAVRYSDLLWEEGRHKENVRSFLGEIDEIFAGNSRYVEQEIFGLYDKVPAALRRGVIEPILFDMPGIGGWRLIRRGRNFVGHLRTPMPDRLQAHNFYGRIDLSEAIESDALGEIDPLEPLSGMREAFQRTGSANLLQRMMHLDLKITLADNDLRKVVGACAMAATAVDFPFLDDELMAFSAQVPPALLIRRCKRRWFFRHAVRNFLAPETLAKHKHGVGMSFS